MSAHINNREQGHNQQSFRKEKLKEIIARLHEGHTVEQVKGEFEKVFGEVSAEEISQAEQALIDEGMQVEEVQKLCDVHAEVFKGSITEIHQPAAQRAGHPIHTLKAANQALRALIADIRGLIGKTDGGSIEALRQKAAKLSGIDSHYKIKENLLFPYMEKYGVTAPPKVMWGVDDEIRAEIRAAIAGIAHGQTEALEAVTVRLEDMAFKEEHIMLPILVEKLHEDEWQQIARDSGEFGFFLMDMPPAFPLSDRKPVPGQAAGESSGGRFTLPTGSFSAEELTAIFNTLPLDITFVDKEDRVRFFSQTPDRAFPRTVSVLGRNVSNCHPPASVHVVESIVNDFKSGRKDHEDFWIGMGGRLIHIRYFALRSPEGEYLGVVETTQDIAPLKAITGEKRLMSE